MRGNEQHLRGNSGSRGCVCLSPGLGQLVGVEDKGKLNTYQGEVSCSSPMYSPQLWNYRLL